MKTGGLLLAFGILVCLGDWASAATRYVNVNSLSPAAPYTNWLVAATNIQDAIDVSSPGDLVLVTNGVYKTGSRNVEVDSTPCRIVLDKPVTVRSVNGPDSTVVEGFSLPGSFPWSLNSVRCAYLTDGASLIGFMLTNGSVRATTYLNLTDSAGGVYCTSTSAVLSNCVIINCAAYAAGGGQSGIYLHSLISNCVAHIGGAGVYGGILDHCEVIWNTSDYYGGGLFDCQATNCNISYNLGLFGGGAYAGTVTHCTVYGNYAPTDGSLGGGYGGGLDNVEALNSIIYYNAADTAGADASGGSLTNCCASSVPAGSGNITNAPLFVDTAGVPGNLHLQANSRCIDAGNNLFVQESTDLDGRPRIVGAKTDVGAYEFQGGKTNSFLVWLRNYALLTDISSDVMDSDADGMNNWQEWRAGTNPGDASSVLKMLPPSSGVSGVNVSWQSVTNVFYYLQRGTNLSAPFTGVKSNIVGQVGTTTSQDAGASGSGPFFYRVGVQ